MEKLSQKQIVAARGPLNLREAAKLLDVHFNTLHSWEVGKRTPSANHIFAIRTLANCVEEFIIGKEIF